MNHTFLNRKYGDIYVDRVPGNPPELDEPSFLIRARDKNAVDAIEFYLSLARSSGMPEGSQASVTASIDDFRSWQALHPELVKVAD